MASLPAGTPSVIFIEDEALLLGLLSEYFSRSGSFVVSGSFTNGTDGLRQICLTPPDLVVLDLQLGDTNGLAIMQQIRERVAMAPRVVVLSSSINPLVVKQLFRLGVKGILQKGISAGEVLSACRRVMQGGVCFDLAEGDMAELSAAPFAKEDPTLTARETEILDLVVRGRRSKDIAEVLGLSARTVDKHRENLMRKLGVHDASGLVRYAAQQGLIPAGFSAPGEAAQKDDQVAFG